VLTGANHLWLLLSCPAHRQLVVVSRQVFDPSLPPEQQRKQQEEQLKPLQQLVTEAAAAYYTAAGSGLRQKQVDLSTSLGSCPPEIAAAIAFKVGAALLLLFLGYRGGLRCAVGAASPACQHSAVGAVHVGTVIAAEAHVLMHAVMGYTCSCP
jgi:hypothetical protein